MAQRTRTTRPPRQRRRYKVTLPQGPCFTVDVGPGGFCAESTRVLAPGTEVTGKIRLDGEQERPFVGRVAWATPGDAQLAIRGRMGVKFTRVTPVLPSFAAGAALH
jgi:hypothetical protein